MVVIIPLDCMSGYLGIVWEDVWVSDLWYRFWDSLDVCVQRLEELEEAQAALQSEIEEGAVREAEQAKRLEVRRRTGYTQ